MRYQKVMKIGLFGLLIMSLLFLTGCFGAFTDWFAPLPGNQPPTATITAPAGGVGFSFGHPVTFTGSATDHEDGDLTGDALVWTSSIDGPIGTGVSFTRSDLSAGTHTITLTATDSHGAEGADSVTIIVHAPPTADIWVDDDFTDATPGWGITRFNTIQGGVDAAASGDTVNVAAGTYTENVVVNKSITLLGEGRDVVTVTATAANPALDVFYLTAPYVNMSGFTVKGGRDGINLSHLADNCHIFDNRVSGNSRWGIGLWAHWSTPPGAFTDNNTVRDNIIEDNMAAGIWMFRARNNIIKNNTILDNPIGIHNCGGSSGNVVHSNNIVGNVLGVTNLPGNPLLDATNNWWGHASGPSGAGPGTGDAVSGNVDFDPWEPSPF